MTLALGVPDPPQPRAGLARRLRDRTAMLHARAEHGGIVAAILADTVTIQGYALYLRNLLPVYQAMESPPPRAANGILAFLMRRSLRRTGSIIADLRALAGPDWAAALPLLPAGRRYQARVREAARVGGEGLLIAHAYTRYLADLSGGQILGRRLRRRFGPEFTATSFTAFPEIGDIAAFTGDFRAALDQAGADLPDSEPVLLEAEAAFALNIAVSEDVSDWVEAETSVLDVIL